LEAEVLEAEVLEAEAWEAEVLEEAWEDPVGDRLGEGLMGGGEREGPGEGKLMEEG
jgi:hypothetical protein